MKAQVLVLAERSQQELSPITLELLGKGRELADGLGGKLGAVILGFRLQEVVDHLADKVDTLYYADDPDLEIYNAGIFLEALVPAVRSIDPALFLLGYTFLGMELGPALAVRLGVPLVSNCLVAAANGQGRVMLERPICGGTLRVKQECQVPLMVSASLSAFSAGGIRAGEACLVRLEYRAPGQTTGIRVREVVRKPAGQEVITGADVLVAVGRGAGSADRLQVFRELAETLGGALACSRPVVDVGWLPSEHLVGLSGSTVQPRIYIACGISGAAQHVAGMSGASTIVAINKDPAAPIFNVAHHGIVGDMFEIVPQITRELSRRLLAKTGKASK